MINSTKSTKDAPPDSPVRDTAPGPETAPFTAFTTLFQKGVERLAEIQKNTVDVFARQAADAAPACKTALSVESSVPLAAAFDMIDQSAGKMAEAQKSMIDLAVQQSAYAVDMAKQRRDYAAKWTAAVAGIFGEAVDRTVAMQNILLGFAAEQNKIVIGAVKRQAGFSGSTPAAMAVDAIERNVEIALQTQKELIDSAAKPVKAAAAAAGRQAA